MEIDQKANREDFRSGIRLTIDTVAIAVHMLAETRFPSVEWREPAGPNGIATWKHVACGQRIEHCLPLGLFRAVSIVLCKPPTGSAAEDDRSQKILPNRAQASRARLSSTTARTNQMGKRCRVMKRWWLTDVDEA